jgi:hypothetical protein
MNKKILGVIVAIIIVGGAAFYAGDVYGKSATPAVSTTARQFAAGAAGARGARGAGGAAGGFTTGQIVSTASGSVTIQLASGSTQIILTSPSTQILKSTSGSLSDLSTGTSITVTGSANSDGSLTAQSIQIRPAGMGTRTSSAAAPTQTSQ